MGAVCAISDGACCCRGSRVGRVILSLTSIKCGRFSYSVNRIRPGNEIMILFHNYVI